MSVQIHRPPQTEAMPSDDNDDRGVYQQEDTGRCSTVLGVLWIKIYIYTIIISIISVRIIQTELSAFAAYSPAHTHRRPAVYSSDPSDRRMRRTPGRAQGLLGSCRSWCRISCGSTGKWCCNCLGGAGGEGRPTADPELTETEERQEKSQRYQIQLTFTVSQSKSFDFATSYLCT